MALLEPAYQGIYVSAQFVTYFASSATKLQYIKINGDLLNAVGSSVNAKINSNYKPAKATENKS
jgi:hypothetical protein